MMTAATVIINVDWELLYLKHWTMPKRHFKRTPNNPVYVAVSSHFLLLYYESVICGGWKGSGCVSRMAKDQRGEEEAVERQHASADRALSIGSENLWRLSRRGSPSVLILLEVGQRFRFEMESFSSYQSSWASLEQFQMHQNALAVDIQKLSQNVQSLKQLLNQLGTSKDTSQNKTQKRELQRRTKQMAEDTTANIKTLQAQLRSLPKDEQTELRLQRVKKLQLDRLREHLIEVMNEFQSLQREEQDSKRQQREELRGRAPSLTVFNDPTGRAEGNGEGILKEPNASKSAGFQGEIQAHTLMYEELDLAALREKEIAIQQLEEDIQDVNQIFTKLATMVHDQGEIVDNIETNVENAQLSVDQGNQQLQQAESYQASLRWKKCVIASIVIVCGIVIGLIIYFYTRK
ncbi:unnamed protein product [Darwinula stevensoni]|uniref:t-SNARE coiled-coil homology domain-containing protein n=1 Tax=Darwinula stevensoni TaxID=69355 RepID=A0A7R8XDC3_9CRUS|nr:unnamed protein product [Darwinula stevensoni]CAG0888534.1 unnamed protein product [Darwinula stevensoni]